MNVYPPEILKGDEPVPDMPKCPYCGESGQFFLVEGWDCWLVECAPPYGCGARGPWRDNPHAAACAVKVMCRILEEDKQL